jgi:hypothetical protein
MTFVAESASAVTIALDIRLTVTTSITFGDVVPLTPIIFGIELLLNNNE